MYDSYHSLDLLSFDNSFFSMSGFGHFLGTFSAKNMVIGGDARSRFLFWSKWEMVAK